MSDSIPRLNLPHDYVVTLQSLADRYGWTFGIFWQAGSYRLETVRAGRRRAYTALFPPKNPVVAETNDLSDKWCEKPTKRKGRLVFGLCQLPPVSKVGDEYRCLRHGGVCPDEVPKAA